MLRQLENEHYRRIAGYELAIKRLYDHAIKQAASLGVGIKVSDKMFRFDDYPALKSRANGIISQLAKDLIGTIQTGINEEWEYANLKNDALVEDFVKGTSLSKSAARSFNLRNVSAQKAFRERVVNGMNLSDRVWKLSGQFRQELEMSLDVGIREGKSAARISQDIRPQLNEPDKLFRRVRNQHGQLALSKNAEAYHPGQGVYRSSYKNALRLTRTETNMAYRTADHERWKQMDFIVGIEVIRSNNPYGCDICGSLAGKYPKDFKFVGWHPNCYDDRSEVLTSEGWKFFKNVTDDDMIFSLNPDTRQPEWTGIKLNFKRWHDGEMIHFTNRSIDCLVTPEHEMVYLNKSDGRIKRATAEEYGQGKGAFYRGCEWEGQEISQIDINGRSFPFDAFVEFMGYWLADGSLIRKSQVKIAQMDGDPNKERIKDCVRRMGLKPGGTSGSVDLYSKELNQYLRQFRKAPDKYIPEAIKQSSKRQIKIFLDAFISCDGYIRKAKSFKGNRGTICTPKSEERSYFTTSEQLASDIGEMILKIGKRPSYYVSEVSGKECEFSNGTYIINHNTITIRECNSVTATVFNKEKVQYSGYVYDLTLEKNAIMYIRRNGKCFWGSNCRCRAIPLFSTEDEFDEYLDTGKLNSKQVVSKVPQGFENWVKGHSEDIKKWKSVPYFLTDNKEFAKELLI